MLFYKYDNAYNDNIKNPEEYKNKCNEFNKILVSINIYKTSTELQHDCMGICQEYLNYLECIRINDLDKLKEYYNYRYNILLSNNRKINKIYKEIDIRLAIKTASELFNNNSKIIDIIYFLFTMGIRMHIYRDFNNIMKYICIYGSESLMYRILEIFEIDIKEHIHDNLLITLHKYNYINLSNVLYTAYYYNNKSIIDYLESNNDILNCIGKNIIQRNIYQ